MNMNKEVPSIFKNRSAVLATMHKKERVISPVLNKELGIQLTVPEGFDSDNFGTFTGDIKRTGNQIEAARMKAHAAMELSGQTLAISSEGSFGSHPVIPFFPFNREIVLLIDKENDLEIVGMATSTEANHKSSRVHSFEEALAFAESIGFPKTGVVVKVKEDSKESSEITKGIIKIEQLEEAFRAISFKSDDKSVYIETDLRAMFNPKRMIVIEAAAIDLVKKVKSLCPECSWPGFQITERVKGLPCGWCNLPTELIKSNIYECKNCGYCKKDDFPNGITKADPGNCQFCNP